MSFYLVISLLLGVCIELILGLDHLLSELRKDGMWKYPLHNFFRYGSGYISLFQVILGYVVITSFFKYDEKI